MAERKRLYLDVNPETAKGVAGALAKHGCANDKMSFAETADNNANLSKRSIERKISIGEKISLDVLDELEQQSHKHNAKHFCKSQKEQLELVKHPAEMQLQLIKRLLVTDESKLPKYELQTKSIAQAKLSLKHEANIEKYGKLSNHSFPFKHGDFTDQTIVDQIEDGSVSLILTDMPYGKDGLPLLED